jgi:hypothetical protein
MTGRAFWSPATKEIAMNDETPVRAPLHDIADAHPSAFDGVEALSPDDRITLTPAARRQGEAEVLALLEPGGIYLKTNMSDSPAVLTRLVVKADRTAQELIGKTVDVVGFAVGYGPLPPDKDTGEIVDGPWLRLLLADASTVGSGSTHLIRSFAAIANLRGEGKWDPPARVKIVGNKLAKGSWLQCYLDEE